jgi:glycosyltransferase involved in cell wall biosynthesis
MLSVLIPVKDWNPLDLIESLAVQLIRTGQPYEILVSDDSNPLDSTRFSTLAEAHPGVVYYCRENPLGRSGNRNFLARCAKYPYLLFIDGDAGVDDDHFIQEYLDRIRPDTVLCGGTLYSPDKPDNPDCLLRWKYGRSREQLPASVRQERAWKSFSTFNFLIPAATFYNIGFDESIKGYGHEDTLFGIHLHQSGIKVIHLNNGLLHLGIEPSSDYLAKIRESGANLHQLYLRKLLAPTYIADISLLDSWVRLKKVGIDRLVAIWFRVRRKSIEKRLCGPNPSLLLLDLYKLGSISHIG